MKVRQLNLHKFLLILIFSLTTSLIYAQGPPVESGNPPPPAVPTKDNKVLITKIIKVSKVENYYYDYCVAKVSEKALEENWSEEKRKKIMSSINFNSFSSTIYNSFALYSKEDLEKVIELLEVLNKGSKKRTNMMLLNEMILTNLEGHLNNILEGKMVKE